MANYCESNMSKYQTLSLIDAESNISYEITVSEKDAKKASTGMIFVHSLLLQAKRSAAVSDSTPGQTTNLIKNLKMRRSYNRETVDDVEPRQLNKNGNSSKDGEHNSGSHNWNRAETLLLIGSYKEIENNFISGKITQKQCWNKVAEMMQIKGIDISGQKCCTKYQTLKRTYRAINDHNRKSGNSRKTWEYYDVMDELCKNKPWVEPLAIAGSNVETEDSEDGKENEKRTTNSKKRINQIFEEYATNCLKEKKLKHEAAEKRHEEKLQILHRMENLLERMFDKRN